jgi:putative regulator of septum formation
MRGLLIRVGIIVAILAVGFIFRDFFSGNASDLKVGDCFDPPTTVNTVVKDVQHHPCSDAHKAEVFYVADYDQASTGYPGDDAFESWVLDRCIGAFQTYTGRGYQDAEELDIQPFWPTEEGWGKGDKEITCFIVRVDSGTMTGSVKAAS